MVVWKVTATSDGLLSIWTIQNTECCKNHRILKIEAVIIELKQLFNTQRIHAFLRKSEDDSFCLYCLLATRDYYQYNYHNNEKMMHVQRNLDYKDRH